MVILIYGLVELKIFLGHICSHLYETVMTSRIYEEKYNIII
jgi:hypothetical protein